MLTEKKKLKVRAGDLVKDGEIAHYADTNHDGCGGTGWSRSEGEPAVCECARQGFMDANIFLVWPDALLDALRWGPHQPAANAREGLDIFARDVKEKMGEMDKKIYDAETQTEEYKHAKKISPATYPWNLRAQNDDQEK